MKHGGRIPVHQFLSQMLSWPSNSQVPYDICQTLLLLSVLGNVCPPGSSASPGHKCHNHLCTTELARCQHNCLAFKLLSWLPSPLALPARHHTGPSGTVASAFSFHELLGMEAHRQKADLRCTERKTTPNTAISSNIIH